MKIDPIENKDITILLHGGLQEKISSFDLSLKSLIKNFNGSNLFLSTWSDKNLKTIDFIFDKVIVTKDPGASLVSQNPPIKHALTRHIVSTVEGLKHVKSKYCLITRDDLVINKNFTKKYINYSKYIEGENIYTKQPILAIAEGTKKENFFGRKFLRKHIWMNDFLFHTCDFLYFGLTSDLKNLFNCSIPIDDPDFGEYFEVNKNFIKDRRSFVGHNLPYHQKYISETYPIIKFLNKKINMPMSHSWQRDKNLEEISEKWHSNNIILINMKSNRISWNKNDYIAPFPASVLGRYSEYKWLALHHKHILKLYFNVRHCLFYLTSALSQIIFKFPINLDVKVLFNFR